ATALETTRQSEQQARDELFLALRNQARARRFSRQMGQRLDSLKALAEAARIRRDEDLRDEAIAALALADVERGPSWQNRSASNTRVVAFDNLYQRYARLNSDGSITLCKVPGGEPSQELRPDGPALAWHAGSRLLFSPDGRFLAQLDYTNSFRLWRLADGHLLLLTPSGGPLAAAFSPNSHWLVVAAPGVFTRFDLSSGQAVNHWAAPTPVFSLAFHPDNRKLAVGYLPSAPVSVYDSVAGTEIAAFPIAESTHEIVAWHPAGGLLATAGSDPRIEIWELPTRTKSASLEGSAQQVTALSFHPTSGLLASASWDGVVRLWDPAAAREVLEIPFGPDIRFSQDGRWLGFGQPLDRIELWSVTAKQEFYTLDHGQTYDGDLSPDGRFLAMGMKDGLRVWDLLRRKLVAYRSLGETFTVFFAAGNHQLLTCGPKDGLQCWSIEFPNDASSREFVLKSPRAIALP
ncbi:MAG: WD40 repeat domain-containing protein, partial [Limisphaerales bacterium]